MRTSLLTRLLAASVLIAVLAIAATAWLAAMTTTGAIRQEQGRTLATDNQIYTTLLGYAATHPNWAGVGPTLETLAQHTDRRIALLTHDRTPVADTGQGPLPATASAVIDPLAVDPALVPDAPTDRIDPDAVGPFRLPDSEKSYLDGLAGQALDCVRGRVGTGQIVTTPSGRPRVTSPNQFTTASCSDEALDDPTPTEQAALDQLSTVVNGCLVRNRLPPVRLALDMSWTWTEPGPAAPENMVTGCVTSARREQLTPYVSPATLLFVMTTPGTVAPFDLSASNKARIALVAAAILVVTVTITVLAGRRLTRPLRALTAAAGHLRDGAIGTRVRVRGKDEIARLAAAFNDMASTRERLEKQRTDMVGDIAHELRTPLQNIRGWLEAAQDGVSTVDPPLVASLLEEAGLLQHIIDDLQDLALADAGTLRLHREPVDVPDLLNDLRATTSVEVAAEPLTLYADPLRLRQMLGNLVTNAVRHTPPGSTITLRAYPDGPDGVIEVADTGPGIAAGDLPHVFERFWRAEKSRNRATGGSGLGLAIVRKLAEAHGGAATAESAPGHGATFRLRLPRDPDPTA